MPEGFFPRFLILTLANLDKQQIIGSPFYYLSFDILEAARRVRAENRVGTFHRLNLLPLPCSIKSALLQKFLMIASVCEASTSILLRCIKSFNDALPYP
jgi:hypothetical protein